MDCPTLTAFKALASAGKQVPVARVLPLETGVQQLFQSVDFSPPCILMESGRQHPVTGRYSILAGEPSVFLTAKADKIQLRTRRSSRLLRGDPLRLIEEQLQGLAAQPLPGFPPFVGGAVVLAGYDTFRYFQDPLTFDKIAPKALDDMGLPDVAAFFCDCAVVADHVEQKVWLITLADPADGASAYAAAFERIEELERRVARPANGQWPVVNGQWSNSRRLPAADYRLSSTHTRSSFSEMVRKAKAFIADGEIYQANLSQRLQAPLLESPWRLYERLAQLNPSPFAGFADFGSFQLVCASPERLFRAAGGNIETRPIAGTRRRGASEAEQQQLRQELILNEKERAEHLMLVDLERNDLGRVCTYGSVHVDELMILEEYSHVTHIVSNVRGRLESGIGFARLMEAAFPGGTITGCPKIRCLEIIDALEPVRRNFYTGALGYLSASGPMDLNLLIRTALVHEGTVSIQAGAGIVADSDPDREYEETLHKARALLEAFQMEHVS